METHCWQRIHFKGNPASDPVSQLQAQIDGVEGFLKQEPRARILDLACGEGRQTLELARRGYRVLGLDAHEAPLVAARLAAKSEQLNAHFLKTDPRRINYQAEFDSVVSLFMSFGYFPSERDNLRVLEGVRKALKRGGKFLLDVLNKEWLMRHFESNSWESYGGERGLVLLDRVSFNFETGRIDSQRTIVANNGERSSASVSLRVYTLVEINSLLERAGLTYRKVWGGFDASVYGMDSQRMIVLAEKAGDEPSRRSHKEYAGGAMRIKGRRKRQ